MPPRLDAHAHFFYPGFYQQLPEDCRRRSPDEITLYTALARQHEITQVLAIGYEGEPWDTNNNAYLASLTKSHPWVRPLAFVAELTRLTVEQLEQWHAQRFVGITLYLFSTEATASPAGVSREVWAWLADHAWLISVNSTGEHWTGWQNVLSDHPQLRLLIAHLGIPPALPTAPTLEEARAVLKPVLALASYPHTYVKFSGFYALSQPAHDYPHKAAWPYADAITEGYGTSRILWASDFSPALEFVSFPQTVDVLSAMPWLSASDLAAIYHDNLATLLAAVEERNAKA